MASYSASKIKKLERMEDKDVIEEELEKIDFCVDDEVLYINTDENYNLLQLLLKVLSSRQNLTVINHPENVPRETTFENSKIKFRCVNIQNRAQVAQFKANYGTFNCIICLWFNTYLHSIEETKRTLRSVTSLLKRKGRLFFSFIGSSPVLDVIRVLREDCRWAHDMQRHRPTLPWTSGYSSPAAEFVNLIQDLQIGLVDVASRNQRRILYLNHTDIFFEHVKSLYKFVEEMESGQQSAFIKEMMDLIFEGDMAHAKFYMMTLIHLLG